MLDLSDETVLNIVYDFDKFRFVRQLVDAWHLPHRPTTRSLLNAVVCGYTLTNDGTVRRLLYVLASDSVCDGMQLDPHVLDDPHDGTPVVAKGIACCRTPASYTFLPDVERDQEVRRRAGHVAFWQKQRKLTAPKPGPTKPKKSYLQALFS